MTQAPCKNCADRAIGCHGKCKDYNNWALKHANELKGEKETMPAILSTKQFTGTGPKPGHPRKTKHSKH